MEGKYTEVSIMIKCCQMSGVALSLGFVFDTSLRDAHFGQEEDRKLTVKCRQ